MYKKACSPVVLPTEQLVKIFIFCQSDKGEKQYLRVAFICVCLIVSQFHDTFLW